MNFILPNSLSDVLFFKSIPIYLVLISSVVVVCIILILIIKKLKHKKVLDPSTMDEKVYEEALKILDKARSDSLRILNRAQNKAQVIVDSTYDITNENREEISKHMDGIYKKQQQYLEELTEGFLKSFRSEVLKGSKESISSLTDVAKDIKEEALNNVEEFKTGLGEQVVEAREKIELRVLEGYKEADKQIAEYKEQKIKDLNNKVLDVLSEIFVQVIGKEIDQNKYESMLQSLLKEELQKSGLN